jgi:hypothetical protein
MSLCVRSLVLAEIVPFAPGGYRSIKGVFQYSAGVAADPGYAIERVLFSRPDALADGFARIEAYLASIGRPTTAFCACELRSPEPFSEHGFVEFNRLYVQTLERWGLYRDGDNPVARTNVCPEYDKPVGPSIYAFSCTVPSTAAAGGFIVAGSGEAREGEGDYRNSIVRYGETSSDALREKMRYVVSVMEGRLSALGFGWSDAVQTQVYTVHDVGALVEAELVIRGAAAHGLTWHYSRPPVVDIEYEMDVIGAVRQVVLD